MYITTIPIPVGLLKLTPRSLTSTSYSEIANSADHELACIHLIATNVTGFGKVYVVAHTFDLADSQIQNMNITYNPIPLS